MSSLLFRSVFHTVGRSLHRSPIAYTCQVIDFTRLNLRKSYSNDKSKKDSDESEVNNEHNLAAGVRPEYDVFRDEDAEIIFDVDEEKKKIDLEALNAFKHDQDPYEGLNMKRGETGVFDIADLVELLRKDKAYNIFVAKVPKEYTYVDYIVTVTGKSERHMSALATFVRKAYKLRRNSTDLLPKIEGRSSKDWIALDLGNIALHIFSKTARVEYDLETLWSVGSKYDKLATKLEFEQNYQDRYEDFLAGLQPADQVETVSK